MQADPQHTFHYPFHLLQQTTAIFLAAYRWNQLHLVATHLQQSCKLLQVSKPPSRLSPSQIRLHFHNPVFHIITLRILRTRHARPPSLADD
jgi:hypothetical protein